MKFLLSGEGPNDLGQCGNAQGFCSGQDFCIGPMTVLLSQLMCDRLGYELLDCVDQICYVSETELDNEFKAMRAKSTFIRGKKTGAETGYYFANALALGHKAKCLIEKDDGPVIAVLFRDTDGTRSKVEGLWQNKHNSMVSGFARADFDCGVAMLPKPKSEAWLLCAAMPNQSNCLSFEDISGNDASPNSAKSQLAIALKGRTSSEELCDWLKSQPVDAERANKMPSFSAFRKSLDQAFDNALKRPRA